MQLKFLLLSLGFCLSTSFAVEIRQAIGEIIRQDGKIFTGPHSRVEVEFPYATLRIGSNADFRYDASYREMSLNRGTLLLSTREDIVIYSGLVTMKTSRGDFLISNIPGLRIKVIALDGKVRMFFAGKQVNLRYAEMVEILAEATKIPKTIQIDLDKLMDTSLLMNMGPLRNQWKLAYNAGRQNPRPVSLVNTPPMIAVSRATATAAAAHQIEAQQALQVQQLANEQLLVDRKAQRLAEQAAARLAVQQASQQLEAKRQAEAAAEAARQAAARLAAQERERQRQIDFNRGNQGQGNNGRGNQGQGNGNPNPPGQIP